MSKEIENLIGEKPKKDIVQEQVRKAKGKNIKNKPGDIVSNII